VIVHNILKEYATHNKLLQYKTPRNVYPPLCKLHANVNCQMCYPRHKCPKFLIEQGYLCLHCENNPTRANSIIRTKTLITDYVLSNDFKLFATFTFDPKKVDSHNTDLAKKVMSKWLNNQRRISPEMKYLIVAEKHKSGRIHFHALLSDFNGNLIDAKRAHKGRIVYHLEGWKFGFSTAIKIDNLAPVALYMQKYITKDMIKISNKKRYWASRNLNHPSKVYNIQVNETIKKLLKLSVSFVSEDFTIYTSFSSM